MDYSIRFLEPEQFYRYDSMVVSNFTAASDNFKAIATRFMMRVRR